MSDVQHWYFSGGRGGGGEPWKTHERRIGACHFELKLKLKLNLCNVLATRNGECFTQLYNVDPLNAELTAFQSLVVYRWLMFPTSTLLRSPDGGGGGGGGGGVRGGA